MRESKNISAKVRLVQGGGVTFGDIRYPPGSRLGPRRQLNYQLVLVWTGSARVSIDGAVSEVGAGEVIGLSPGTVDLFEWDTDHLTRHTWCSVAPGRVEAEPGLAEAFRAAPVVQSVSSDIAAIIELGLNGDTRNESGRNCADCGPGTDGFVPSVVGALGTAAIHAFSAAVTTESRTRSAAAVTHLQKWLDSHLDQPVSLPLLASIAGVSTAQLVRFFKRDLSTTPIRWIWLERTRRGIQLLRDTGLPVGEIAWRCGFRTPFHFSRRVHEIAGMGPRDVRRRAWSESGLDFS